MDVTGRRVVHRLRMIVAERANGSDQRQLIHSPGQIRKKLGNLNSGDIGGNGTKGAAGLRIPGIHLARTALQKYQNARLRFAFQLAARSRLEPQGLREMNSKKAKRPDSDEIAPPEFRFASTETTALYDHGNPL